MRSILAASLLLLMAPGCSGSAEDGVVDVAFIGTEEELSAEGLRLAPPGQHLRTAEAQGLVRLNEAGQLVPAIAERWIVTDDGASYIFRIREFDLPGGERLTAQAVRDSLVRTMARLSGTTLGLDLAKIADIRAMTGRVIEIRLESPMPGLLQLLAQPEMGLAVGEAAIGPMRRVEEDRAEGRIARVLLEAMPPEARGLPSLTDWAEGIQQVAVYAVPARTATEGFADDSFDIVFGGTIADLPLADSGPLSRGTIRLDSAVGLFGLDVTSAEGFLGQAENREAVAMAIDRTELLAPFNIGGWTPTTRIVAPELPGDNEAVTERWSDLSLDQRRARAAARVAQWRTASGQPVRLRIALPPGPGSDLLFSGLARDLAAIGVAAVQVAAGEPADLALRDRVARYAAPRWFLNQFNCRLSRGVCDEEADRLVALSVAADDASVEAALLAQAEQSLTATNLFIPLGAPIRWSLVRAGTPGFIENPWSIHPLFPLSRAPI